MISIQSEEPKTGEPVIPISDALYDCLQNLGHHNSATSKNDYVVSAKEAGKIGTKLCEKIVPMAKQATTHIVFQLSQVILLCFDSVQHDIT